MCVCIHTYICIYPPGGYSSCRDETHSPARRRFEFPGRIPANIVRGHAALLRRIYRGDFKGG